jgi:hypothetical protein
MHPPNILGKFSGDLKKFFSQNLMNLGHYIKNEKSFVYRWKSKIFRLNFGKGLPPPPKKKNHWMETDN